MVVSANVKETTQLRTAAGRSSGNLDREYVRPIVRALATPSAHPSAEAWPGSAPTAAPHTPQPRIPPPHAPEPRTPAPPSVTSSVVSLETHRRNRRPRPAPAPHAAERFAELQRRLPAIDAAMRARRGQRSIVVVPSRPIDESTCVPATAQALEERLLFTLLMLRDPSLRVIYVTSSPVPPAVVDYYLSLIAPELRGDARSRLTLLCTDDASLRPLTEKLLERPRLLARVRRAMPDTDLAHLAPYETSALERDLAVALGIPMYGADPCHAAFGTKSGGRELFARAGVPHPLGVEHVRGASAATAAIAHLRRLKPDLQQVVVKLNDGVAGQGNAVVDVRELPAPGSAAEADAIAHRLMNMALEAGDLRPDAYLRQLAADGGIVEERIVASELRSPSVQFQVTPAGEVEILSTHDQLLGGPTGQTFLGCSFPAQPDYARTITQMTAQVARRLAQAGVIGRAAVDFIVARDPGRPWRAYAIELNLRKGGTTHPFMALELLTGGTYDAAGATFATPTGEPRHYVATDRLEAPELRSLGCDGVLGLTRRLDRRRDLGFDRRRGAGVVFHMLSCADEIGRTGFTAIGDSAEQAREVYERAQDAVLLEAAAAAEARRWERSSVAVLSAAA